MSKEDMGASADAEDGDSYRMNPDFRRFLAVVGSVDRAMVAWDIARETFAPSDPEGDAEYEVWQGDEMVAGASGPRARALAEAVHYAVVYQSDDDPCIIREVTRREVSPEAAHTLLASGIVAAEGGRDAQRLDERSEQSPAPEGGDAQP